MSGPDRDPGQVAASSAAELPAVTTKGEQTRRAILEAATGRFGREGYRATSVADIARDAGVSGTLAYAYFPNKEALFLAALDEDTAHVIEEGVLHLLGHPDAEVWRETLILTLVDAVERHPLARRVLAGLEPHVTDRMLEIPAMTELRKAVTEQLRSDQAAGKVRPDIDAATIASGTVVIVISLLMSILQFGRDGAAAYGRDVLAVFAAALDPIPPAGPPAGAPAGPPAARPAPSTPATRADGRSGRARPTPRSRRPRPT